MATDENYLARAGYRGPKWGVGSSIFGQLPDFNTPVQTPVNVPALQPMQPLMLSFAPHQQEDDGWGSALGQIGGGILSRILARRSRAPVDGGHTSEGHVDEPIIQPHYDGSGVGGEHQVGFARGGILDDSMVGKRFKFAENEPEIVVDEQGRTQLITQPTEGVATRPAMIVPVSHLKAAASMLGQELPPPDYREIYRGPRWNPSQFNDQVDNLTRSSLATIGGQKPSAVVQNALQAGPRWPMGAQDSINSSTPIGQKPLPQSQSPMSVGFKTSAVTPSLAFTRDDTHNVNEFASPDVRSTLGKESEYGLPAGLGYTGPRWDVNRTDEQTPQQSPSTSDVSTLSVEERRKGILDASNACDSIRFFSASAIILSAIAGDERAAVAA